MRVACNIHKLQKTLYKAKRSMLGEPVEVKEPEHAEGNRTKTSPESTTRDICLLSSYDVVGKTALIVMSSKTTRVMMTS